MGLIKQYKTDTSAEKNGVRIVKGSNDDNSEIAFYIARTGASNTDYKIASERAFKPIRHKLKDLKESEADSIMLNLFCGQVLKGWENVRNEATETGLLFPELSDGSEVPFSVENAKVLMTALPDLYNELNAVSNDMSYYLATAREADAKN